MPKIISNIKIKNAYFKIILKAPKIAKESQPGQFLQIKVNNTYDPLLRRPLGIHRIRGSNIEILYEVVGKGTDVLSERRPGEFLDVIGPLGKGFTLNMKHSTLNILVAGGMGVAPLVFLAEKLAKRKMQVLIGGKTKGDILCDKEFHDLGCQVKIATDNGSRGFKGKVTDLLGDLLWTMDYGLWTIYACGPRPMLKEIALISKKYNIPAQVSLEEHLACGIGACLGCVVNTKTSFKRVCKEGPVFNVNEIIWE